MITCSCTALAASRITSMHHSVLDMKTMWCRMSTRAWSNFHSDKCLVAYYVVAMVLLLTVGQFGSFILCICPEQVLDSKPSRKSCSRLPRYSNTCTCINSARQKNRFCCIWVLPKRHTTQHFATDITHAPGIYVYCRKLHNHARQQQDKSTCTWQNYINFTHLFFAVRLSIPRNTADIKYAIIVVQQQFYSS